MAKRRGGGGQSRGHTSRSGGVRALKSRVKTAKGRKVSSTRWLSRQLNDPYVAAAQSEGRRSRAAYKLAQIDDKYQIFEPGQCVVDLGAAPGGWSLVAAERVGASKGDGRVVAVDLAEIEPIAGGTILKLDFMDTCAPLKISAALGRRAADVVLSDMAAPATGHKHTDHMRIMGLCEAALSFAQEFLTPGGTFLAKVLQGGTESSLLNEMKRDFRMVRHVKPDASRSDSAELYVLATDFRGSVESSS